MKYWLLLCVFPVFCSCAGGQQQVYTGCTPAGAEIRLFLDIPLADSIDFIRWQLTTFDSRYELQCEYGLSQPNTNGFSNGQLLRIDGELLATGQYYQLRRNNKTLLLAVLNQNLLHLADRDGRMLSGNDGYSYALNNAAPVPSGQSNFLFTPVALRDSTVFEGRTPCRELAKLLGLDKSPDCIKMKWRIILYTDPVTRQPAYYLRGGRSTKREDKEKGQWALQKDEQGRTIYKLWSVKTPAPMYLLSIADNILCFTDADGNLLTGNKDFSYTLNRTD